MKIPLRFPTLSTSLAALCLCTFSANADVKLPAIFGDHMVLQQEATLPVWGWAAPGEKVTVSFEKSKAEATADADGKWRADLAPIPAGTAAGKLVVAGKNTITLDDVLVGDVWLCSGQSNMEFRIGRDATKAKDDQIRLFHVAHQLAIAPRTDVVGKWEVCSPETAGDFSAVGYYFGKDLRADLHRPIGLIESSWGGTGAQEWTDLPTLEANPKLRHYAETMQKINAQFPQGDADYAEKIAASDKAANEWKAKIAADTAYQSALKDWQAAAAKAKADGQPTPAQPKPPTPPPSSKTPGRGNPTLIFNGMIAPLVPFAMKGVIWYQGENNANNSFNAQEYRTLFPAMIEDWRKLWHEEKLPFLFVQLANFESHTNAWAELREAQLKTLSLPKTGMAVIIDIGTGDNIHPPDKADVGERLSLAARHIVYGENLAYTGPIFDSMKVEDGKVRISFKPDSIGGGLIIGKTPWQDPKAKPLSTTEVEGFAIAGADQKWVKADAKIEGDHVVVSSPEVAHPTAVRYGWADNPRCNLYNKEGLPASPFRTDEEESSKAAAK